MIEPETQIPADDSFGTERARWLAAIPGVVDEHVESVRQRIGRIARQFERVVAEVAAREGLSVGDLEALSTLARSADADGELTPGDMAALLGLTSGTVSVRIERLVRAGLVEQRQDARCRPVTLTEAGREAWGRATLERTRLECRLLHSALDDDALAALDGHLAALLATLEAEFGPAPRHDMTRGRGRREG